MATVPLWVFITVYIQAEYLFFFLAANIQSKIAPQTLLESTIISKWTVATRAEAGCFLVYCLHRQLILNVYTKWGSNTVTVELCEVGPWYVRLVWCSPTHWCPVLSKKRADLCLYQFEGVSIIVFNLDTHIAITSNDIKYKCTNKILSTFQASVAVDSTKIGCELNQTLLWNLLAITDSATVLRL